MRWGKSSDTSCQEGSSQLIGRQICGGVAPFTISDKNFDAVFLHGPWTVSWRWTAGEPKQLQSRIGECKCTRAQVVHEKYPKEVQSWISKCWLVERKGPVKGFIPLLTVVQPTKDKVRPVMDFSELNPFIESHTEDDEIAICADKVHK